MPQYWIRTADGNDHQSPDFATEASAKNALLRFLLTTEFDTGVFIRIDSIVNISVDGNIHI